MGVTVVVVAFAVWMPTTCCAWMSPRASDRRRIRQSRLFSTEIARPGNVHGQGACFLPLEQLNQDFIAPRIVQVQKE